MIDRIADNRLQIYLYHILQNFGVTITFGLIEKLRTAYPEIVVGIKDSASGAGAITACNNICAALSARVFNNWQNDDANAPQQVVNDVRSVIPKFPLVAALKEILAQATGEPGWRRQRPPLESLSKQDAAALVEQLVATGFTLDRAA